GDIPYFIDGGAGGELYTEGPVGTDHGYWHGFRLVRVDGATITTDTVPIFVPDSIRIEGPDRVARGENVHLFGFGRQPVFNDPAKVEALELRDPDPRPRSGASLSGIGQWALLPGVLLLLLGLAARTNLAARGGLVTVLAIGGFAAVSVAQQEEPTSTPKDVLPTPARIWTSADPSILRPVASHDDDPRRDAATQTDSGVFRAICPGTTYVELASGFEAQRKRVTSLSASGPIVRGFGRRARTLERGSQKRVAAVRLNQPARVVARVRKGRRFVRTLSSSCVSRAKAIRWDGRIESRGRLRRARPGLYTIDVRVRSDRKVELRRYRVRLR
ncbi:MAG TPA: hypothetical protein VNT32_10120, partial [Thermoleophilaceae bacterium]|nr:hypothetical protein [Thermoleophilaceae bacterium]